ncbi:AmmeMemoRadiSam system radical SAM enzyme [archaeon SCG-AAA382B04]|nr:AmmeMemoRadiSam system radical SAM enzyme [archaeon SCG-AAA382B04]
MEKEASLYHIEEGKIQCDLCNHRCIIPDGEHGICGVRKAKNKKLYTQVYGAISSRNADPIEKKPLYHFKPKTRAMSYGSIGCNFSCKHCQNYSIATAKPGDIPVEELTPEESVKLTKSNECKGIAYTYNEPTVWFEFNYDSAKLAKKEDLYTVYVTNGYMTKKALEKISPYLDAANVDIKAFNNTDFYENISSAQLKPVLETCKLMSEKGIHLELTYLVIPEENDDEESFKELANWIIEELGEETPLHLSRFYPSHKMLDKDPIPIKTLERAREVIIDQGMKYVYIGNVSQTQYANTYCPACDELLIERRGYSTKIKNLSDDDLCKNCGEKIDLIR